MKEVNTLSKEDPILKTDKVTKKFGGITAVNQVDYQVKMGESVGIIGPNGAGKSTFFNLITGKHKVSSGKVFFKDEDITNLTPEKRVEKGLIRTFQLVSVFNTMTVLDNMLLASVRFTNMYNKKTNFLLKNRFQNELVNKSKKLLEKVKLINVENRKTSNLSYGEKRKLELAIALSLEPEILLLDECLAGLSEKEIDEFMELIPEISEGLTTVIIEHKITRLVEIVDRISVMHEGRLIAEGDSKEVINRPKVRKIYWGEGE